MKVLLVYTNINGFHSDTYSFGLSTIISVTKSKGHEVEVCLVKTKDEYGAVIQRMKSFQPQVIGFSTVSSQFHFANEICALIKEENSNVITVCGGVHPTINPQGVKDSECLDAVFVGESEYAFIDFLNKIEKGEPFLDTDNLAYVKDGKMIVNPLKPLIKDLDELPFPDRDSVLFQETLNSVGYASFFFSRGCPYLCTYCSNHAIAKCYGFKTNKPRYRSPEKCIQEIEDVIQRFDVNLIAVLDDILGINKEWHREFCKKYKERIKVKFFCLLRANLVDEEFIQLLKEAGCYRVSMGVESGNDHIRNKVMKRALTEEQIVTAFELCRKYGIETNSLNIIGVPGETEEMIWDTINLNRKLKPTSSGVNIFYPYKGTELGDSCFAKGLVDEELYNSFSAERRSTTLKYPEEFKKKLIFYSQNWEDLVYQGIFIYQIKRFIKIVLVKLHLWEFLRKVKRGLLKALK